MNRRWKLAQMTNLTLTAHSPERLEFRFLHRPNMLAAWTVGLLLCVLMLFVFVLTVGDMRQMTAQIGRFEPQTRQLVIGGFTLLSSLALGYWVVDSTFRRENLVVETERVVYDLKTVRGHEVIEFEHTDFATLDLMNGDANRQIRLHTNREKNYAFILREGSIGMSMESVAEQLNAMIFTKSRVDSEPSHRS